MSVDQYLHRVGGEWVGGSGSVPDVNPSDTREVVGEAAQADAALVAAATRAARAAADEWAHSGPQQRFEVLDAAGAQVLARRAELGRLLASEEGKPIAEATAEVARAGQILKYFAGEALRQTGDLLPSVRPGLSVEVTREPVGVVGLVTPWNFPIAIPAWKVAPALAFGNTVVLKPSELVPGCATELVRILVDAGLPDGVLNLVHGSGAEVGGALVSSPDVDAVSFTGSVATGRSIAAACVPDGRKVQLEMGGKNPLVVLDDADLDVAVSAAVNGAYFSTGQRCTASSRLVVTEGVHDAFVERLAERVRGLRVGHALAPDTVVGPVVDDRQLRKDLDYLAIAAQEGGEVVGGERVERDTPGWFLSPALVTGTTGDMRINREEVFGPVASVVRVADYDAALAEANATEFGLSAGVVTTSLRYAKHFARHARAGMVMVNAPTAGVDPHVPFGGSRASSYGPREQGAYAREFYTTVKTTYVDPG
nr:aldehyde dehydrogenase family protein [uncultured Pseudokineococcus sp.]